jgi:hypothetical protein
MSKLLTDAATWETHVECPVSGDARNAASVEAGLQDLANRTTFLNSRLGFTLEYTDTVITESYNGDTDWHDSTDIGCNFDTTEFPTSTYRAGDEIMIFMTFWAKTSGGAGADAAGYFRIKMVEAGNTYSQPAVVLCGVDEASQTLTLVGRCVLTVDDGGVGVVLQVSNHDSSMTSYVGGWIQINCIVIPQRA